MAEFSWAAAADVGLGLMGGVSKGLQALGAASVARSNSRAQALVREGQNAVRRSRLGLAATVRDLNNDRMMENAADQLSGLTTTALRTSDAFARGKFEESIRGAEQWGAAAARASASGLGGSGIEAISRVTSLQIARRQELMESQGSLQVYEAARAGRNVISNALLGLDQSPLTLGNDFSQTADPGKPNIAGLLINGLLDKKASLQTLLGSLVGDQEVASPTGGAVSTPVSQSTVTGTPLASFEFQDPGAIAYPVNQSNVQGTPLGPVNTL